MKKLLTTFILVLLMTIFAHAQTVSLLLCERYDMERGPIGVSTVFTTGYLTVVSISDKPMYYDEISIQYDRLGSDGKYYFYKKFPFTFPNGYQTVYFSRVGDNDMEFNIAGNYIVWLLDKYDNVISSTTVTIVDR